MTGKTLVHIIIAVMAVLLMACHRTAPQRPSQRLNGSAPEADSASLAILTLNQKLAMSADDQLLNLMQAQEEQYALYESNTWMTILDRGDETEPTPQLNEEWTIRMKIYTLEKELLVDTEQSYTIGKEELPEGVENKLGYLHRYGKARLLVPWYSAYGVTGTKEVEPYENLIIEIELK